MGGVANGSEGGRDKVLSGRVNRAELALFDEACGPLPRGVCVRIACLEWAERQRKT